ncbi:MAG: outer membrane beta-barrel protein [Bacteroidia bacterium]
MKQLFLLPLAFITLTANAQKTNGSAAKWQVGVCFSPDATNSNNQGTPFLYRTSFGFATGLNASRKLNKQFRVDAGLLYAQRGEKMENLVWGWHYRQNGFNDDTLYSIKYKHKLIEIPVKLKWYFKQGNNFNLYTTLGVSANFYDVTKVKETFYNSTTKEVFFHTLHNESNLLGKLFPSAIIGIGVEYKLNAKLSIVVQPEYRYYLISTFGYIETLTALGVNCGVSYNL